MRRARGTQHRAATKTVFERMIYRVPPKIDKGFHLIALATRKQITPALFYMKTDNNMQILNTKTFYDIWGSPDIEPRILNSKIKNGKKGFWIHPL